MLGVRLCVLPNYLLTDDSFKNTELFNSTVNIIFIEKYKFS